MAAKKNSKKQQASKTKRSSATPAGPDFSEDSELSPAQVRELEKRIKDLEDRTRYVLASTLGPNFVLYYNVAEDSYGWNDPMHATMFKRRKAAEAIRHLLGDRDSIYQCAVDKKGQLIKKSLVAAVGAGRGASAGKDAASTAKGKSGRRKKSKAASAPTRRR